MLGRRWGGFYGTLGLRGNIRVLVARNGRSRMVDLLPARCLVRDYGRMGQRKARFRVLDCLWGRLILVVFNGMELGLLGGIHRIRQWPRPTAIINPYCTNPADLYDCHHGTISGCQQSNPPSSFTSPYSV